MTEEESSDYTIEITKTIRRPRQKRSYENTDRKNEEGENIHEYVYKVALEDEEVKVYSQTVSQLNLCEVIKAVNDIGENQ